MTFYGFYAIIYKEKFAKELFRIRGPEPRTIIILEFLVNKCTKEGHLPKLMTPDGKATIDSSFIDTCFDSYDKWKANGEDYPYFNTLVETLKDLPTYAQWEKGIAGLNEHSSLGPTPETVAVLKFLVKKYKYKGHRPPPKMPDGRVDFDYEFFHKCYESLKRYIKQGREYQPFFSLMAEWEGLPKYSEWLHAKGETISRGRRGPTKETMAELRRIVALYEPDGYLPPTLNEDKTPNRDAEKIQNCFTKQAEYFERAKEFPDEVYPEFDALLARLSKLKSHEEKVRKEQEKARKKKALRLKRNQDKITPEMEFYCVCKNIRITPEQRSGQVAVSAKEIKVMTPPEGAVDFILSLLEERPVSVLRMHYGLNGISKLTLEKIALEPEIKANNRQTVERIEKKAVDVVRDSCIIQNIEKVAKLGAKSIEDYQTMLDPAEYDILVLRLSSKIRGALRTNGINTIGDIQKQTAQEILGLDAFGPGSFLELMRRLQEQYGIVLVGDAKVEGRGRPRKFEGRFTAPSGGLVDPS